MKDLSRLLNEPGTDPLEADLLRLARSEGPSSEGRRRILAGLGVAAAASTASHASAAEAPSAGSAPAIASRTALKWGLFGSLVVGGAAVALLLRGHPSPTPAPQSLARPAAVAASASGAQAKPPVAVVEPGPITKLEDLPALPGSTGVDTARALAAPSLADEVAAIKGAKNALAAGNAAESLRELDAYRAHFPHGRLAQEASVVRIEALLKSGNRAAASAAGDRFLAAHADSPYAARVHSLIGH